MDTLGTVLCAASLGPVAGMICALVSGLMFVFIDARYVICIIIWMAVGLITGLFYPRDRRDMYMIMFTAAVSAAASVFLSSPINLIFFNGYTSNVWGNALIDMLKNAELGRVSALVLGEIMVDIPDKVLMMLITAAILRNQKRRKLRGDNTLVKLAMLPVCLLGVSMLSGSAAAEKYYSDYDPIHYDKDSGLSSLEINAVEQTNNGYIWVGSYSGLYRYDGSDFTPVNPGGDVSNVMALFSDSSNRLWIATNDMGLVCYDSDTGEAVYYTTADGLPSNAVRCIEEDGQGNIYAGTAEETICINADGRIGIIDDISDMSFISSMSYSAASDVLGGVTNSGEAVFIKKSRLICTGACDSEDGVYFTSLCASPDGSYILGTSAGGFYRATIDSGIFSAEKIGGNTELSEIVKIVYDSAYGGYFVCADNGFGYLEADGRYESLNTESFNSGVCDAVADYQGNIWFASQKQGLNLMTPTPFYDVFEAAELDNHVVNSVIFKENLMYVGCDDGLIIIDNLTGEAIESELTERLIGVRIRHVFLDSRNNLWISTYGADGLICAADDGTVTCYNEITAGTEGGRFRSVMELSDGSIVAAGMTGLTHISEGKVIHTVGAEDGMDTPQILTLAEAEDGSILAGSDGDGIYKIKDGQIIEHISDEQGLKSNVILRIVKCTGGYLYVTSNSIMYDNGESIRYLDKFPYSNNYDIYITDEGEAWISSSGGIYIVSEAELLKNEEYNYELLDQSRGFDTTLTSNSWNCTDDKGNLYLCCSTGVNRISIADYDNFNDNYQIRINKITVDGDTEIPYADGKYTIPATAQRISIYPAVLNFTRSNPLIRMRLEGFDNSGVMLTQDDMQEMDFTNLPKGTYKFYLQVLDPKNLSVEKELIVSVEKEAQLFENAFFKVYVIAAFVFVVIFCTWILARYGSVNVIRRQYEEIRKSKEAAECANTAKSQLLANVSHEIRTPLNTIIGMDELILREDISDDVKRYAMNIRTAGASLLSIINDILDFSKIESGKMKIIEREYRTDELFHELAESLHVRAAEKNLSADIKLSEEMPSGLYGDPLRIKQVLQNLLSNAVKYTESGTITLSAEVENIIEDEVFINISVRDTGIGIKEENISSLFEKYERFDEQRNSDIQGTGLGLNITCELLRLMGSELRVESEYGNGSVFSFTLRQKITDHSRMPSELKVSEKDENSYIPKIVAPDSRILLIDDNAMNLDVVKGLLRRTQIRIDTGVNGFECLEKIKEKHYDLILLDHMMPEMDGIETFSRFKTEEHMCKDTPVIILTANAIAGAKEMYLAEGFSDYLTKPVSGAELEEIICRYITEKKGLIL